MKKLVGAVVPALNQEIPIPRKLRDDCIIEALCELQFNSPEIPEVVLGRLADATYWSGFSRNRLPMADIPAPIRNAGPFLKYQPVLELKHPDNS